MKGKLARSQLLATLWAQGDRNSDSSQGEYERKTHAVVLYQPEPGEEASAQRYLKSS